MLPKLVMLSSAIECESIFGCYILGEEERLGGGMSERAHGFLNDVTFSPVYMPYRSRSYQ